MTWDPAEYLRFSDHRLGPGLDLLARVPDFRPETVIDLGCGPGNLTVLVADRFPHAHVIGLDDSDEMLTRARATSAEIEWVKGDIADWSPEHPMGLVFSNAALHWVDRHDRLFGRLAAAVAPSGVLAVQIPDNWNEPTHVIPAELLDSERYGPEADAALARDRLAAPSDYRRWIGAGFDIDTWTTTYHQALTGPDPVLRWVEGSLLRPVLNRLTPPNRDQFLAECARRYRDAYPPEEDGTTTLPFRRMFIVARRR
jgi:trans-aconitate 2-methyltransferase